MLVGYDWWLPIDASAHGAGIDRLIVLVHWFMLLLFVGWGAYFIYCLWRFRSRPGHEATTKLPKAKLSKLSEVAVIVVEAVLLCALSIPLWAQVRGTGHAPGSNDRIEIRVQAQQFAWNIQYPGADGKFGRSNPKLMDEVENPIGIDRVNDPAAADDIVTLNVLHIPVNRNVLVHLSSKDVIHSFSLPLLRIKQDSVPGISVPVWFKATRTTDQVRLMMVQTYPARPEVIGKVNDSNGNPTHVAMADYANASGSPILAQGDPITADRITALAAAGIERFEAAPSVPTQIACAQLCGMNHFQMRGFLYIDTQEKFDAWMKARQAELPAAGDDYGY